MSMIPQDSLRMISLKEEEIIQELLNEHQQPTSKLDCELETLLNQDSEQIKFEYERQADFSRNRLAVQFYIDVDEAMKDLYRENFGAASPMSKEESLKVLIADMESNSIPSPPVKLHLLDKFESDKLLEGKLTGEQLLELDRKYPKLNSMSMLKHPYPIFQIASSSASKYLKNKKVPLCSILIGKIAKLQGTVVMTLVVCGKQLLVFSCRVDQQHLYAEPVIFKQEGVITALSVSQNAKYLGLAFNKTVVLYQIKGGNLMAYKTIDQLDNASIRHLNIYGETPLRLYSVDQFHRVASISIDYTLIFTKIKVSEVPHQLKKIASADILANQVLLALANSNKIQLFRMDSQISFLWEETFSNSSSQATDVCLAWRDQAKPQLFVSFTAKVFIYKLQLNQDLCSLELFLTYHSHYSITSLHFISPIHLLLSSAEHALVIAIPLLSSNAIEEESINDNSSEAAMVFVSSKKNYRVMDSVGEFILFVSSDQQTEALQFAQLKTLPKHIDELILRDNAFQEAFTLLILVAKGLNCSFRFQYSQRQLKKVIGSSICCALSSLFADIDSRVALFRIGWLVQLCVEAKVEEILWNVVCPRLKDVGHIGLLWQVCEVYFLKNQLSGVPEDLLLETIKYFSGKGRLMVIQALISSNRSSFDSTELINLLQSHGLYYLQFYIFSRGMVGDQCDYYTPFLRAFTSFGSMKSKPQESHSIGLTCLWYMRKCFRFEQIPRGMLPRDSKVQITTDFFIQTLAPIFLHGLAEFNLVLLLQCYLNALANQEFKQILEEYEQVMIDSLRKMSSRNEELNQFIQMFIVHLEEALNLKRKPAIWAKFTALVLFYSNSGLCFEKIADLLIVLVEVKYDSVQFAVASRGRSPTSSCVKLYLLNLIAPELSSRQDRLCIRKLLSYNDPSIAYLLHRLDKNYQLSLEHFLDQQAIFPYIRDILHEIKQLPEKNNVYIKERKMLQLKSYFAKNVAKLFALDANEALQFSFQIGETITSVHNLFEFNLLPKINFLTAVLERFQREDFQQKNGYLCEHLSEVVAMPEEKMLAYLRDYIYPLDMAIAICEQRGNLLAKAIFEERSGLVEEAFRSYERLIRQLLTGRESEQITRAKVQKYIYECIRICKQSSPECATWLKSLKLLTNLLLAPHQYKIYLKVEFERLIQVILTQMLDSLSTKALLDLFISRPDLQLSPQKTNAIHEDLIRRSRFSIWTLNIALLISKQDILFMRINFARRNRMSSLHPSLCDFCKCALHEESRIVLFACGHAFHSICHEDTGMCLACQFISDQALFDRFITEKARPSKAVSQSPKKPKRTDHLLIGQEIYVDSPSRVREALHKKRMKCFDFEVQRLAQMHQEQLQFSNKLIYNKF